MYKSWKKSTNKKDKGGSPELHEQYKSYRRTLKHLIKSAKQKYFFNEFDKHKNNKKKTWQIINKLRGKSKSNIKSSFIIDNERITCRRIIANKFNEYFVSLAKNLNTSAYNEVPLTSYPSFRTYFSRQCATSIFMEDCDPEEIMNIISEFENGKSSDIPITLIKNAASIMSPTLARLYNNCIAEGYFPNILKIGKITPIYKKGNKELIENYRPVSTLPIFGKNFEKIIWTCFFLRGRKILSKT